MFEIIKQKIGRNTKFILRKSKEKNLSPRVVAEEIAKKRVWEAMRKRKISKQRLKEEKTF